MGEKVNAHSLKAYHDNYQSHLNKTEMCASIIYKSKRKGISASEYAKIVGACCKHSVSPALSRVIKNNPQEFVLINEDGKKNGRYYCRLFL